MERRIFLFYKVIKILEGFLAFSKNKINKVKSG